MKMSLFCMLISVVGINGLLILRISEICVMKKNEFYDRTTENNFLLENIQGGIVYSDFDPPFRLRYVTEGMCQLSGYTHEELRTLEQMDIVHPDDADRLIEDVGRQFAAGDVFEVEYRLLRKDGSFVYALDRAKAVAHENGKKYIHCLLTDITCLKQTQPQPRNVAHGY